MNISFRTLLLIFLVALLGACLGTFGAMELSGIHKNGSPAEDLVISQVQYTDVKKNDYTLVIDKAFDTVVEVNCRKQSTSMFFGPTESESAGSGVIISADGFIVTNHHVVEGAISVTVKLSSSDIYEAQIIGSDSRSDIALLKIEAHDLKYANFADSDQLMMGQEAIAIGNPLGKGISCSNGIVSALEKEVYLNNVYMDLIQTNASVNEGNSGGGLFNMNGDLIGIVNAKSSTSSYNSATVEGMGYAIPSNKAIKMITDIREYGYVKDRPTLGISVRTGYSNYYIYDSYSGLQVTEVIEGGGAKKAGMLAGDIITNVDSQPVDSYATLSKILDKHDIGDKVDVVVNRDGKEMTFSVELTEVIPSVQ